MNLLYITNGINGPGGLERVLSIKASWLADHYGYNVSILVLNDTHRDPFYTFSKNIRFFSINVTGPPLAYYRSYKKGIQKIVDQAQPEIISVCDDGLKGFFIPIIIKTGAKIIYERHVSQLAERKAKQGLQKKAITHIKWYLMAMLGSKFSKFIVLTEGNKNEWPSLKNLQVIPNPLPFFPDQPTTLAHKQVICVGKISYQKGQDLLLESWNQIHKRYPDWTLALYGKANRRFLKTDGLEKLNIYHYTPEKEITKRYRESSIYVMPSRYEGFGMVLIEAMACGLPCVSFDCPYGPSDIITEGVDGFLVEKGNVEVLAEKICFLIEHEEIRRTMGKNARLNVVRFTPEQIIYQWDKIFKQVVGMKCL